MNQSQILMIDILTKHKLGTSNYDKINTVLIKLAKSWLEMMAEKLLKLQRPE